MKEPEPTSPGSEKPTKLSIARIKERLAEPDLDPAFLETVAADPRKGVQKLLESHRKRQERQAIELRRLEAAYENETELRARHGAPVGGVDEAGRGPLAGPVVAACVILPSEPLIPGLNDSKTLTRAKREALITEIETHALGIGIGIIDSKRIDEINIYQAAREAMMASVQSCKPTPPGALILDAMKLPGIPLPQLAIPKADATRACVMAASIVAKVTRDRMMAQYDQDYPGYGFTQHQGYGTAFHLDRIRELGPSPIHRMTFAGPADANPQALADLYSSRIAKAATRSDLDKLGQEIKRKAEVLGARRLAVLRAQFRDARERLD